MRRLDPNLEELVRRVTRGHPLIPAAILCGLVMQESQGRPEAYRFEPNHSSLERPIWWASRGEQSEASEIAGQKASWGLTQILGSTARRFGFQGDYFSDFCRDAELALEYAIKHLERDLAGGSPKGVSLECALARYNGGLRGNPRPDGSLRNQAYVTKVLTRAEAFA